MFEKIRNNPFGILRGPGDTDLWKKPEVKNLVSDFFNKFQIYIIKTTRPPFYDLFTLLYVHREEENIYVCWFSLLDM
jgi:hypothetical protein